MQPHALGIASRHQRGTGRRADARRGVEIGQAQAFGSHPVQVGRLNVTGAIAGEVGVAQIIGEDQDDVGLGGGWIDGCLGAAPGRLARSTAVPAVQAFRNSRR